MSVWPDIFRVPASSTGPWLTIQSHLARIFDNQRFDVHINPPLRSLSTKLDIIYLQPHTFIWHGTPHGTPDQPSLNAATVDQVLGRNNFFGHHDYAAEYATYGGRRTGLPGGRRHPADVPRCHCTPSNGKTPPRPCP